MQNFPFLSADFFRRWEKNFASFLLPRNCRNVSEPSGKNWHLRRVTHRHFSWGDITAIARHKQAFHDSRLKDECTLRLYKSIKMYYYMYSWEEYFTKWNTRHACGGGGGGGRIDNVKWYMILFSENDCHASTCILCTSSNYIYSAISIFTNLSTWHVYRRDYYGIRYPLLLNKTHVEREYYRS